MFVDSDCDDFLQPIDHSYGYAKETSNCFRRFKPEEVESPPTTLDSVAELIPSQPLLFPSKSFLSHPSQCNSFSPSPAQRTAIDAGCSEDIVRSFSACQPSEIEVQMTKMNAFDKKLLEEQLGREGMAHWDSSSVYSGLGVDENANVLGLSLNRLNDLLCNADEHLLIIRREVIRYRAEIEAIKSEGTSEKFGLTKAANREQLALVCNSLIGASRDLAIHVGSLANSVEKNTGGSSLPTWLSSAVLLAGVSGCAYFLRRRT